MTAAHDIEAALADLAVAGLVPPCALAPDRWFDGGPTHLADAARACRRCPVIALCGRTADEQGETWGVWGGRDRTAAHVRHAAAGGAS